jgi:hypothetical protein
MPQRHSHVKALVTADDLVRAGAIAGALAADPECNVVQPRPSQYLTETVVFSASRSWTWRAQLAMRQTAHA